MSGRGPPSNPAKERTLGEPCDLPRGLPKAAGGQSGGLALAKGKWVLPLHTTHLGRLSACPVQGWRASMELEPWSMVSVTRARH